jgi:hypothetical protein
VEWGPSTPSLPSIFKGAPSPLSLPHMLQLAASRLHVLCIWAYSLASNFLLSDSIPLGRNQKVFNISIEATSSCSAVRFSPSSKEAVSFALWR